MFKKGYKHSDEIKQKMSEAHKGKKLSDETKRKISQALAGRKFSKEHKRKLSQVHKGRIPWNKGIPRPKGKNSPNWKGGIRHIADGRIAILKPEHLFADKMGYIRRSRLVMEKMIGRHLKPCEQIHHINGIVDDDRPENLKLFPNFSAHMEFHKR